MVRQMAEGQVRGSVPELHCQEMWAMSYLRRKRRVDLDARFRLKRAAPPVARPAHISDFKPEQCSPPAGLDHRCMLRSNQLDAAPGWCVQPAIWCSSRSAHLRLLPRVARPARRRRLFCSCCLGGRRSSCCRCRGPRGCRGRVLIPQIPGLWPLVWDAAPFWLGLQTSSRVKTVQKADKCAGCCATTSSGCAARVQCLLCLRHWLGLISGCLAACAAWAAGTQCIKPVGGWLAPQATTKPGGCCLVAAWRAKHTCRGAKGDGGGSLSSRPICVSIARAASGPVACCSRLGGVPSADWRGGVACPLALSAFLSSLLPCLGAWHTAQAR